MSNSYLVIDSENTTWSKGDAQDQRNRNVCWSYKEGSRPSGCTSDIKVVEELLQRASIIIGFHLAYDLEWLWKLGISTEGKKFYCCQVAEFILNNQTTPYPSLDDVAHKYTGERKLDVVKTEYWDKGINTDEIPWDVLAEYARRDVALTEAVYLKQQELIPAEKQKLIGLAMQDMQVLAEMRFNGMRFDRQYAQEQEQRLLREIDELKRGLDLLHSIPSFNWASTHHLSALLYGGQIEEVVKVPAGNFKSGKRVGEIKFKNEVRVHRLPRRYKPLRDTAMAKDGVWSTDEDTLRKLNDGTSLIAGILRLRELSKLNGTYFAGIPERAVECHWQTGYIYGQFNQCVAATGRLSSSKPNLQNIPSEALKMFTSRWEDE
jgi:DNA polymerase I-like protein with 3'-5' exonuclease and polymerase domains